MNKIIIEEYSNEWSFTFNSLKEVYKSFLGNLLFDIQHVGSTSVEDLSSKPIIDIDLIIENREMLNPVIEKLAILGYKHYGDLGITDRDAFKRNSDTTPNDGSCRIWPKHNLYVCPQDSISLKNHLELRDFLRKNPEKAKEYGELKKKLVLNNSYDIDLYIEGKTSFITEILKNRGFDENILANIIEQNKVK